MKKRWIDVLAASEVIGGCCCVDGYLFSTIGFRELFAAWQLILGFAFGTLSIGAGILLARRRKLGYTVSTVVQVLQVVSVTRVSSLCYVALSGLKVWLIVASNGIHIEVGGGGAFAATPWARDGSLDALGVTLQVTAGIAPHPLSASTLTIGINAVAIFFLALLIRHRH